MNVVENHVYSKLPPFPRDALGRIDYCIDGIEKVKKGQERALDFDFFTSEQRTFALEAGHRIPGRVRAVA
jgi:hypothetical protein